ncbi:MAG TPA: CPBP family intramembrane glutamic endopeptidase [Candidatus Limnocylindrales bacterium]|nr:CPBP family intramembrane glutamic endopeptidase [Candidatus Limnocylindrales bacterium]
MDLSPLEGTFGPAAIAIVAALVAVLVASGWLGRNRFVRLLKAVRQNPRALDRFYRRTIVSTWIIGLVVPVVLLLEPDLSPADVGLRWPAGDGLDYVVALLLVSTIVFGGLRRRRLIQSGRWADAGRSPMMALLPRTPTQRRLAVGISVTAGVVEEAIFRGLLIASAVAILRVPVEVAALLTLILFAWGHQYQGRAGMLGAGLLGVMFTGLYLISGSILLPAILHTTQDLVALLTIPVDKSGDAAPLRGDAAPPHSDATAQDA